MMRPPSHLRSPSWRSAPPCSTTSGTSCCGRRAGPAGRAAAEAPLLAVPASLGPAGPAALDPLTIPAPPRGRPGVGAVAGGAIPFLFGDETRAVARPSSAVRRAVAAEPVVRSILYSADRRLAIVDGRIVGVGDAVGGYTVADIEQDAVVFTAPSGERLRVSVPRDGARHDDAARAEAAAGRGGRVDGNDLMRLTVRLCSMSS